MGHNSNANLEFAHPARNMKRASSDALADSVRFRFTRLCASQDVELTVALHTYGIDPSLYALPAVRAAPSRHIVDEIFGSLSLPKRAVFPAETATVSDIDDEQGMDILSMPELLRAILDHPPRAPAAELSETEPERPFGNSGVTREHHPASARDAVPRPASGLVSSTAAPLDRRRRPQLRPSAPRGGAGRGDVVDVDALDNAKADCDATAALLRRDHAARLARPQLKRPRRSEYDSGEESAPRRPRQARRGRFAGSRYESQGGSDSDADDARADAELDRTLRRNPYCAAFNSHQGASRDENAGSSQVKPTSGFQSASAKLAASRRRAGVRPSASDSRAERSSRDRGFAENMEGDGNDVARTVTRAVLGRPRQPRFSAPKASNAKRPQGEDGSPSADLPEIPNIEPRLVEMIMNEALDKSPGIDWDDIAGLHFAKKCVMEAVIWPMLRPDIFQGLRGPPKGLLLFGPPGTGKTVLAKTIASKCDGSKFFSISASSLMSKWVGEGEKMVRALFAVARELQPSIIFIDEIDSLLTQRTDGDQESSRRVKTEFLVQMDGAATSRDDRVLVIGATNRPAELDEAARRRMVKRLYIPLPDDEARLYLVKRLLLKQNHTMSESDYAAVVKLTMGYSGSDIYALCAEASLGPVRDLGSSIGTIDVNSVRPIVLADFQAAGNSVRASVAQGDLVGYREWNGQYGSFELKE